MITTIQVEKDLKEKLDTIKIHPRETYNELLMRILQNTNPANFDKESLIETIEVLSDPETMRDLAEATERINKGDFGTPLEEFKKELGI